MNIPKKILKLIPYIIIPLGFIFSIGIVFHFFTKNSTNTSLIYENSEYYYELPVRLKIPSIKINAAVNYVGLTPDGAMDSPKNPPDVAWFNLGPRPGENGSAVIDGHSGWKNGKSAVFDNLHKLKRGDKLYIENEKGVTITFIVRELKTYNPNTVAFEVFNSSDGKAHLNLITCSGFWDETHQSHSDRLVVFADKE
ncbi:MAG: class F sortase [Minisyncoccia bacterium]